MLSYYVQPLLPFICSHESEFCWLLYAPSISGQLVFPETLHLYPLLALSFGAHFWAVQLTLLGENVNTVSISSSENLKLIRGHSMMHSLSRKLYRQCGRVRTIDSIWTLVSVTIKVILHIRRVVINPISLSSLAGIPEPRHVVLLFSSVAMQTAWKPGLRNPIITLVLLLGVSVRP